MTSKKDLAKSISTRLSQLAVKLKIPYENISTEFLIERLVVRLLTDSWLLKRLVFKGGYVRLILMLFLKKESLKKLFTPQKLPWRWILGIQSPQVH